MSYLPAEKLAEVVMKGFGETEVERAKNILFEAATNFSELKTFRKKIRKNTGHKRKVESDVEDILELCYAADRMKVEMPRFASIDINVFLLFFWRK